MIQLEGKRVVVVGLGKSGVAACDLLLRRGANVVATDQKPRAQASPDVLALEARGARLVLGGHAEAKLEEADLVVVSPGVPPFAALAAAEKAGVRIWGEVELAVQALRHASPDCPIVAVGGTNGKSTTTELVSAMLEACLFTTFTGGNLGEPLAAHADEPFDAIVLEVSSFQMERVESFRPRVSILLNVTPDHLDRYDGMDAYASAKGNAFAQQTEDDVAVVPAGDAVCLAQAKRGRAKVVTFGPGGDVDVTAERIVHREARVSVPRAELALAGEHNAMNFAAAMAAAVALEVQESEIREVARTFRGLPHRMVFVAEHAGVRYYDDSKGTNVGASVTALLGAKEPKVVLVLGGKDKGGSYEPLASALREKGRAAVLIGEAAELIAAALGDAVPVRRAATMEDAVRAAADLAQPGDAVLLSPACSSFDMFKDYKERGDVFVRAVRSLASLAGGAS
jgi:UDP-N-acetylmuramoylalanine--D-glutamate ligase